MSLGLCTQESQSVYCNTTSSSVADFEALHMLIICSVAPMKFGFLFFFFPSSTEFTSVTRRVSALLVPDPHLRFWSDKLKILPALCPHLEKVRHFREERKNNILEEMCRLLAPWLHERLPSFPKESQPGEIKPLVAEHHGAGLQHFSPSNIQHRGLLCVFLTLP